VRRRQSCRKIVKEMKYFVEQGSSGKNHAFVLGESDANLKWCDVETKNDGNRRRMSVLRRQSTIILWTTGTRPNIKQYPMRLRPTPVCRIPE
jgi:hypothetical protein